MGALDLPASGVIYLDANCFIYSVERIEPYSKRQGLNNKRLDANLDLGERAA